MNITGFEIENFKGIREAKIEFSDNDIARIHTLVGLNESGKTTLLEAMHSFSPDSEAALVVEDVRNTKQQVEKWVPKDKVANFTGEVSVLAHVECSDEEWLKIREFLKEEHQIDVDPKTLKSKFTIRLAYQCENGDYTNNRPKRIGFVSEVRVRKARQKNFRPLNHQDAQVFCQEVYRRAPSVAYYPTFFFDFPEKIYLTSRDQTPRNQFYRQLFADILDYEGSGYTIKGNILNRVHAPEFQVGWDEWNTKFRTSTNNDKVKQVVARAERAVTEMVFPKWNEVFREEVGNKEISINLEYDEGEASTDDYGDRTAAVEHDVYIRFQIKDGTNIYNVDERSLGFRWFFAFLMFTQFRIHRKEKKPTIFLFDEPASNLHAAAQKKLLESFPAIAESPHRLVYSTHSHYMVNPLWLEQAYIVYDAANNADKSEILEQGFRPDASVDVKAVPYRKFVRKHPQKINYFQPVLDTLEVSPSKFDLNVGGLIVEGKSDYYLLKASEVVAGNELGVVFPAQGSGTMGALVALHRGWGLPVRVLLDGDQGGDDGRKNLLDRFQLQDSEITSLSKMVPGIKTIEDIFSDEYRQKLIDEGSDDPKRALLRIVQESVAAGDLSPLALDKATKDRMTKLIDGLRKFVDSGNKGKS